MDFKNLAFKQRLHVLWRKMSNYQVLNPVEHKNTRIVTERGEALETIFNIR